MSKTRSWPQNRESLVALSVLIGLGLLVVINVIVLVPVFLGAYGGKPPIAPVAPIDTAVVNEAVKSLGVPK